VTARIIDGRSEQAMNRQADVHRLSSFRVVMPIFVLSCCWFSCYWQGRGRSLQVRRQGLISLPNQ
jgi:hypothetical protein